MKEKSTLGGNSISWFPCFPFDFYGLVLMDMCGYMLSAYWQLEHGFVLLRH